MGLRIPGDGRRAACLALLLAVAALPSPAEEPVQEKPQAAAEPAPAPAPSEKKPKDVKPPPDFKSTEEVPADMGIDFPVDI